MNIFVVEFRDEMNMDEIITVKDLKKGLKNLEKFSLIKDCGVPRTSTTRQKFTVKQIMLI